MKQLVIYKRVYLLNWGTIKMASLYDSIKKVKQISLSFRISPEDIQELDKGKAVVVTIQSGEYTIKRKPKAKGEK